MLCRWIFRVLLLLLCPLALNAASASYVEAFNKIYAEGGWAGQGSGDGSVPQNAAPYMKLLQSYISDPRYKKIVDLGCGDWQIMRNIEIPQDKSYTGYDVASIVIKANQAFARENVRFVHITSIQDFAKNTQGGDLIIVKDVLQHMPNKDVQFFIEQVLPKFKYALITNDYTNITPDGRQRRRKVNSDTKVAGYRALLLQKEPFNLKNATVLLEYAGPEYKQVLLYKNPNLNIDN